MKNLFATTALTLLAASAAQAHELNITIQGDQRCIVSNGIPDHEVGTWREGAVVEPQDHLFCVDAMPENTGTITERVMISGMTVTGVPLRPGTAEYYDPTTEKGWSRDRSSGWNVEGVGGLIMDAQNAHVDGAGMYHYHGIPEAVMNNLDGTLFAYATDGFEIHYVGSDVQSSYQLKDGEREGEGAPEGVHDGTYVQDWEYVDGSGTLDECNGTMVDGEYVYYATDTFPFFPRCLRGNVTEAAMGGGGGDRPERPEPPVENDG
ncbi:YHYH protein [Pseudosulfitobacter sp. SM2401]|uniref:YHYH protein n=1 Tax=Pseudosulfitobacter sp. SM2401 TaxID=3350098 RepID=UPI0036F44BAC